MKNRIISWLLVLCMVFSVLPATALAANDVASGTCGDDLTWTLDEEGTLTISGTGEMTDFPNWNSYREQIKDVIIHEGATSIGQAAFSNCANLVSVTIPDSVTSIGKSAFLNCNNLKGVAIPNKVTIIADSTFQGCSSLRSVVLPEGVTSIGGLAFYDCSNLINVRLPGSISSIGIGAFMNCNSLESIVIPHGVANLAEHTLSGCSKLKEVILSDSITSIGDFAFANCNSLEEINIPESVTKIGIHGFGMCSSLKNVIIPEGVTIIDETTFSGCSSLESITLPDSLIAIGYGAFQSCDKLTTITIPLNVMNIGEYVFSNCSGILVFFAGNIPTIDSNAFSGTNAICYYPANNTTWTEEVRLNYGGNLTWIAYEKEHIHEYDADQKCECGVIGGTCGENLTWTLDAEGVLTISGTGDMASYYEERAPWYSVKDQIQKIILEDGVTTIGDWAFLECSNLVEASLPDTLKEICFGAFDFCENLESIVIPNGVTAIGAQAFVDCNSLTEVEIPGSVQTIGRIAFSAIGIEKVTLNEGLVSIGEEAFSGCALSELTIPSTVKEIGDRAFSDPFAETHSKISSVIIPEGVETVGKQAFCNCEALEYVSLPSTLTNLGYGAFGMCPNLTEIELAPENQTYILQDNVIFTADGKTIHTVAGGKTGIYSIPENVTTIADYAFTECVNLTEITIPNSVINVGIWAFNGCSSLKEVTVPNSLTTIPGRMFACCDNLKTVVLPDTITSIEAEAFAFSPALEVVNIPSRVTSLGQSAFRDCTSLQEINIPEGIVVLPRLLFACCESLTNVTIPASVSKIEYDAFGDCYELKNIIFVGNAPVFESNAFWKTTANAYYPQNNSTWTAAKRQNYGGAITWIAGHPCDTGHSYDNGIPTIEPTCTENGVTTFTCSICGRAYTEAAPLLGHDIVNDKGYAATCTEPGLTDGRHCTRCDAETVEQEVILAIGCSFTEYHSNNDATCVADGTKTASCDRGCGTINTITDEGTLNPGAHIFGEWVTEDNEKHRTCELCGYTEHKISTDSGDVEIEAPEQPGLDFEVDPVEPTDEQYVLIEEAVNSDGDTDREVLKAFDITLENADGVHVQPNGTVKVKLPLDWEKDGNYKVYRVNEDGTLTDMNAYRQGSHMVFETDHFSLYIIVEETTHEHHLILTAAVAAGCETAGNKAYYICSGCDKWFEDASGTVEITDKTSVVLPELEHDYRGGICGNCGEADPDYEKPEEPTVPSTPIKPSKPNWSNIFNKWFGNWWEEDEEKCKHTYISAVTDPTCTQKGYTTHTCAKCGNSYKDCYVEALGHDYEDGKCSACGAKDPSANKPTKPNWGCWFDWIWKFF